MCAVHADQSKQMPRTGPGHIECNTQESRPARRKHQAEPQLPLLRSQRPRAQGHHPAGVALAAQLHVHVAAGLAHLEQPPAHVSDLGAAVADHPRAQSPLPGKLLPDGGKHVAVLGVTQQQQQQLQQHARQPQHLVRLAPGLDRLLVHVRELRLHHDGTGGHHGRAPAALPTPGCLLTSQVHRACHAHDEQPVIRCGERVVLLLVEGGGGHRRRPGCDWG